MASYNAVNKIPDTVSPFIRDIVEKEWKFDGMVCTDAGSLPNLTRQFHYYPDPTAAVVGCVKAGITVFLDQYAAPLRDALEKKLLTEADIERNIRGNMRMRMRLGEFDPPEMVALQQDRGDRGTLVRREEQGAGPKSHSGIHRPAQEQRQPAAARQEQAAIDRGDRAVRRRRVHRLVRRNSALYRDAARRNPEQGGARRPGALLRRRQQQQQRGQPRRGIRRGHCLRGQPSHLQRAVRPVHARPAKARKPWTARPSNWSRRRLNWSSSVKAANPKTIVVLISSFPYAMSCGSDRTLPAILHMAHSSQEEGNALADVLFGDYNPAGRLVATWVKSLDDLPPMMDYDIRKGRTYMYFKGQPLYPFGFGLSYTTFEYSNLRTSADSVTAAGEVVVSVDVKNTGTRAGDEVVQTVRQAPRFRGGAAHQGTARI